MDNSNRIRERRKELGLSGPEVAAELGISTQYLYDIERGKRGLSGEILINVSEILKATTDYLLKKTSLNFYGVDITNKNSDPHEESELADIPIEKLNQFKLTYKGHELSKEEADDVINLLEAALKRWKK
ncbi:DNA-binding transcriptional regulator, XRE-family HTH domain [Paenibacillus uliginis N3/975]|uniref:DNA-binding transcriptional regulator, XRE-family HTH domain n=1 Tax=Paenibacillus uliginis N3/975 TaxID=1313296 RepID=A0A1X7HK13_9BACL|nr:helix-turn-helix domain-containing protein [Paenibacillus uliginis]SMF88096.1 DNA-binding transcriptional regulator, XRE-family HTH domain [Paenibacillus uliginis N3/975]